MYFISIVKGRVKDWMVLMELGIRRPKKKKSIPSNFVWYVKYMQMWTLVRDKLIEQGLPLI